MRTLELSVEIGKTQAINTENQSSVQDPINRSGPGVKAAYDAGIITGLKMAGIPLSGGGSQKVDSYKGNQDDQQCQKTGSLKV